jgi:Uma2 family endonuclease
MVTTPYEYHQLPTAEDLPDSDDTPVDNQLQNLLPNLLLNLLDSIWRDRDDWFWAVDMGVYYEPNIAEPVKSKVIVPDGFLALGVPRNTGVGGRLSYVLWHEKVVPTLALEVISKTANDEYEAKRLIYQELGILYYIVYNTFSETRRYRNREALEVYKLNQGKYELLPTVSLLQEGKMVWMPEIELGIGYELGVVGNWERDWLYWYNRDCVRYSTAEERAEQAVKQAEQAKEIAIQAEQKSKRLAEKLRLLGIDPDA